MSIFKLMPMSGFLLFLTLMGSCSNTEQENTGNSSGFLNKTLNEKVDKVRSPIQTFELDITKTNQINTAGGSIITVLPGTFEAEEGAPVTLHVKEAFKLSDMVLNGLDTRHANGWLMSDGMLYIEATQNGTTVPLKKDKKLAISIRNKLDQSAEVFLGTKKENSIVWETQSNLKTADYIIPYPVRYVGNDGLKYYFKAAYTKYRDNIMYYKASPEMKNDPEISKFNWYTYLPLEPYLGSLVMTKEFEEMYEACAGIVYSNQRVVDYYLEHSDKPLWVVDSIFWTEIYGVSISDELMEYKDRRHGKVIKLDYEGVDLDKDGYSALKELGLSEIDIITTLSYHEQRKKNMALMDKEENVYQFSNLIIGDLGWINLDRYYNPDTKSILLNVKLPNEVEAGEVFLIGHADNIVIKAKKGTSAYYFGASEEAKVQLPSTGRISIIAIGLNGEQLMLGEASVLDRLKDNTMEIELKAMDEKEFKTNISYLD